MSKNNKIKTILHSLLLRLIDIGLIWGVMLFSVRFIYPTTYERANELLIISGITYTISYLIWSQIFKIYRRKWLNATIDDVIKLLLSIIFSVITVLLVQYINMEFFSKRFSFLVYVLSILVIGGSKISMRVINTFKLSTIRESAEPVLIVGAGQAGRLLIDRINKSSSLKIRPIGLIDEQGEIEKNTMIMGVPVLGHIEDIKDIIDPNIMRRIIIAVDTQSYHIRQELYQKCKTPGIEINVLPVFDDIITGDLKISSFRKINVEDLLGRDRVDLDIEKGKNSLGGKTILITGAGGSIGSEITRQLLKYKPKRILIMGHGENSIYQIHREIRNNPHGVEIIPIIRDIKDRENCEFIFNKYRPDIVYHAAAHKHVPLMEANPKEAIRNNAFGTLNIGSLADKYGVDRFVMLSTDKAVNPTSVMGATKRIAEEIIRDINKKSKTKYVSVRFGNVIGSRGSVIPLFQEQIEKGGPVTITDKNMTRYFMAIPEAASLVIQVGELEVEGEIFVLDMGEKVAIYDLAKEMIRLAGLTTDDIEIKEIGIREGEKITEEYITDSEHISEKILDKIFVGRAGEINTEELDEYLENILSLSDEEAAERTVKFANQF